MTTSLPTSPAADALAGSAAGATATPSLLDLLAATNAGPAADSAAPSTTAAPADDFAALLEPTAPGKPAGATLPAAAAADTAARPALAWRHETAAQRPSVSEPLAALRAPLAATEPASESTASELPLDRSTLEAAVALVLNFLPPPAPEVPATPVAATPSGDSAAPAAAGEIWSGLAPGAASVPASAASGAEHLRLTVTTVAGERTLTAAEVREGGALSSPATRTADSASTRANAVPPSAPAIAATSTESNVVVGAKLGAPSSASAVTAPLAATSAWCAVQAEVEWEGGVKLAAELASATPSGAAPSLKTALPSATTLAATSLRAPGAMEPMGSPAQENSAVSTAAFGRPARDGKSAAEKNFLTPAAGEVTTASPKAGIDVAQSTPAMPAASHQSPLAAAATAVAPAGVPQRAEPAAAPAPEATAQRAVETVLEIVHAQAVAKLQPVPSVQLRFKVGQEDLAVRVRLRDGAVHTEFRTDNAELRAALTQEWRAVTAKPEAAFRFLEPVITGTNSAAHSGSSSGHGGTASQHQQQHAQQQAQQFRAQAESFGSVRRVFPAAPASTELAPITPLAASASHRLSAVA